tara:strand:- start:24846 stop:25040 length:195 start_codon:yes stop_codon:yes gene_type:complete
MKNFLKVLLNFTTGLGFYGIGLLGVAVGLTFLFGWGSIPAGFVGAFIFKNYAKIVEYINEYVLK